MTEREHKVTNAIITRTEHPDLISWRSGKTTYIVVGATINWYVCYYIDAAGIHSFRLHKRDAIERIPKDILHNLKTLFGCEVMLEGSND